MIRASVIRVRAERGDRKVKKKMTSHEQFCTDDTDN